MITVTVYEKNPNAMLRLQHSGWERHFGHWVHVRDNIAGVREIWCEKHRDDKPIDVRVASPEDLLKLDWWASRALEKGISIRVGKDVSNTGFHYVELDGVRNDSVYEIVGVNSQLWLAGETLKQHTNGCPHVRWSYERGVHSVLLLKWKADFVPNLEVECRTESEPFTCDGLKAYYLCEPDNSPGYEFRRTVECFRIGPHAVGKCELLFRGYDKERDENVAVARLFQRTLVTDDNGRLEMDIGPGWWMLVLRSEEYCHGTRVEMDRRFSVG